MTVKRKLVVTTIAASLVAGSLAGIPLSNKGLAAQLGLSNVASASAPTYDQFMARLDAIHTALIAGGEAQSVRDLRTQIGALTFAANNDAINPLWVYVPAAVKNDANKELLFDTFQALGSIMYSTRSEEITAIRSDADLQAALVTLAGVTDTDKLTVNDLLEFVDAVETAAVEAVQTNLADLLTDESGSLAVALIKAGLKDVLDNNTLEVSKVLNWFKDNTSATKEQLADGLAATFENFTTELPAGEAASKALVVAGIRAESVSSAVTTNNGRTQTYSLALKGITIPALQWSEKVDNANISVTSAGVVTLANTANTATFTLQAKLLGKVVFEGPVTLTYSSYVGGGYVPVNSIFNDLSDLKSKIAAATGAEKDKLIKEAIDKAFAAISAISAIDVSKDVSIVDGKATVNVSNSAIGKVVTDTTAIINALKDAAPGAEKSLPNIVVSFEAGKVDSKDITFNVDADSVKKLTAAGIYGTKFVANGIGATVPVSESKDSKISFNVKNAAATKEVIGTATAASDVFDFTFNAGGTDIHEFTTPVQIQLPVSNTDGIDTDLLTLAKIINGKLEYYGGKYSNGTVTENRDTFSSYVVVENKVTFQDTNKVKAWAGRQIEVMAAKGAIQGRANGAFVPNGEVTRAEFAKMLVRALDLDNVLAKEGFSDVNAADWFAPFVAAASEAGIIKGRTATSFAPNATITRAEMAVMVARGLEAVQGVKPSAEDLKALDAFKDAGSISASLKDGVAFAANNGLVVGDKGKFNPNATATRAQAAVIIYRAFNFKG